MDSRKAGLREAERRGLALKDPKHPELGWRIREPEPRATGAGPAELEPDRTGEELPRELAYRASDGVEVSLFWTKLDDSLTVLVTNSRTGEAFELPVGDDKPLEVFNHPYGYAASRGVGYGVSEEREPIYS